MDPMLNIAIRAVRKAGNVTTKHYEIPRYIETSQIGNNEFVANIEREAERQIIDVISKSYPHHTILSEEKGEILGKDKHVRWLVRPLDGITNYIKHLPHFCISIAVCIKDRTEVAVIYDPIRNELFSAVRGKGAQLNGYRLRGSVARNIDGAILATGFPFKCKRYKIPYLNIMSKLFTQCTDFRHTGSTALDLAYVAAGRIDGYFELGLKLWDFSAGVLIVREAGSLVTDFVGGHEYKISGNIIAGNPRVVKAMLANMREE